jgi:hypothetical protein
MSTWALISSGSSFLVRVSLFLFESLKGHLLKNIQMIKAFRAPARLMPLVSEKASSRRCSVEPLGQLYPGIHKRRGKGSNLRGRVLSPPPRWAASIKR